MTEKVRVASLQTKEGIWLGPVWVTLFVKAGGRFGVGDGTGEVGKGLLLSLKTVEWKSCLDWKSWLDTVVFQIVGCRSCILPVPWAGIG